MKIAILSDIHGNSWALKAVLEYIKQKGITEVYDLGDSLYGPLDPQGTFALISENRIKSISGNEDRLIMENRNLNPSDPTLAYVLNVLTNDALNWLDSLPKTRSINQRMLLCHGTPVSDTSYLIEKLFTDHIGIKDQKTLDEILREFDEKIILCGHSHVPNIVETPDKIIINPGSVGLQAYDDDFPVYHKMENHSPKARFCLLEVGKNLNIEQIAMDYDYMKAAETASKNNRDDWARWIMTGRV